MIRNRAAESKCDDQEHHDKRYPKSVSRVRCSHRTGSDPGRRLAGRFHYLYDDSLWRMWRRDHLRYVNLLLSTVGAIPDVTLEKLTWMGTNYEPEIVSEAALKLLALAASESYPREDVATMAVFLGWLIEDVMNRSERQSIGEDAPGLMRRWLPVTDPLRIAQDPECGYRLASRAGCA